MNLNLNEQLMHDTKGDAEVCILVANLASWMNINFSKDNPDHRNFREGRYWSYNSYPELVKFFGFWTLRQVRVIVSRAVKLELITIGNFNKKRYDNTNWYTLTDKGLNYYPVLLGKVLNTPVNSDSTPVNSDRPIPEELNSLRDNNTNSESGDSPKVVTRGKNLNPNAKPTIELRKLIEIYAHHFPKNPQPHPRVIATSLEKTLRTLVKRWPEADPNKSQMTYDSFDRYMELLKNTAPCFTGNEYITANGNKKMNTMETFCRWNTFVKFLENQYS